MLLRPLGTLFGYASIRREERFEAFERFIGRHGGKLRLMYVASKQTAKVLC